MNKSPYEILIRPVVTEKSTSHAESDTPQYTFEVHPRSTKPEIQKAIEKVFNVKVVKVNTLILKGKIKRVRARAGRRSDRKKAFITLAKGQKLELL